MNGNDTVFDVRLETRGLQVYGRLYVNLQELDRAAWWQTFREKLEADGLRFTELGTRAQVEAAEGAAAPARRAPEEENSK